MRKKDEDKQEENNESFDESGNDELYKTIECLQKEKDELFAQLQRVSADYANFQKRVPRQISDTINYDRFYRHWIISSILFRMLLKLKMSRLSLRASELFMTKCSIFSNLMASSR